MVYTLTIVIAILFQSKITVMGYESLWPLNNQTLAREISTPPDSPLTFTDCVLTITSGPVGFPGTAVVLHGDNVLDLPIDTSSTTDRDFGFFGMFRLSSPGTLFHYKADQLSTSILELKALVDGSDLYIIVKTFEDLIENKFVADLTALTSQEFSAFSVWNHFSFGINVSTKTIKVLLNDVRVINAGIATDSQYAYVHVPGVLRVGGAQDGTQQNMIGSVTCVGFLLGSHRQRPLDSSSDCNPSTSVAQLDKSNCSISLGLRPYTRNGYFRETNDTDISCLTVIRQTTQSTEVQCAYACLMNMNCWFYKSEPSSNGCFLYSGIINPNRGNGQTDEDLYAWFSN